MTWLRIVGTAVVAGAVGFVWLRIVFAHYHYSGVVLILATVLAAVAIGLSRTVAENQIRVTVDPATRGSRRLTIALVDGVSWRLTSTRGRELLIAGLAVAMLTADHAWIAARTGSIPCTLDCGETYHAHIAALNLYEFGLGYTSGLEDVAASRERAAHPTVYTHNANLGMYFVYALFLLGVRDVHAQSAWIWVPFATGLLYLYLFIRSASRHGLLAALCLLNAAALYLMVTLWGFQPLRVFSWLLTFGPAYHLHHYAARRRRSTLHLCVAMLYIGLSLGIDYPFAVFSFFNALALALTRVTRVAPLRMAVIAGGALAVAFGLRQLQVASVVGAAFWARDFGYTVARRVPLVGILVTPPSEDSLRSMYSAQGILKWPDPSAVFAPGQWLSQIMAAQYEVLGIPLLLAGLVLALV